MEGRNCIKVCVTGGSGFIASLLVKKLLERGYTVHATLRNLGCHYVFHLATPLQHNSQSSQYKDTTEAAIAGVKSIADCCIRSDTVKRLIYTASVMSSLLLNGDGTGYKSSLNESCWTPLNISTLSNDFLLEYTKSKTLAEKEVLRYNEIGNGKLEVVTLPCGLVGGDNTLLSYLPPTVAATLSPITGNLSSYDSLRFLQELLGSIPLVHIDDVCEAHIFCIQKESLRGRFLCVSVDPTIKEMANYYQGNFPQLKIAEELMGRGDRGSRCDSTKLVEMGFEYKYDMKKILDDSVACQSRLKLSPPAKEQGF